MSPCGCKGNKNNNKSSASRVAIYQVFDSKGGLVSEHGNAMDARKAAAESGGKVRITSRNVVASAVT